MIIKFFVSNTCPQCPKVKEYFKELEKVLILNTVEMYNQSTDKHQFLFHSVMSVPTVIVCTEYLVEVVRYIGYDEIMNNKEDIECLELD